MADKYASLAALEAALVENQDYRIRVADRNSWATIISPHGGYIESGSSALAESIATGRHNLFDFQGLKKEKASELHVTSTRFRHEMLDRLLARSCVAVSLHCMGIAAEPVIWLGGRNLSLKEKVLQNLRQANFLVNPDSPRYRGESRKNIVNLSCSQGVQLELSLELMQELFQGAAFRPGGRLQKTEQFHLLSRAVCTALDAYAIEPQLCACRKEQKTA